MVVKVSKLTGSIYTVSSLLIIKVLSKEVNVTFL